MLQWKWTYGRGCDFYSIQQKLDNGIENQFGHFGRNNIIAQLQGTLAQHQGKLHIRMEPIISDEYLFSGLEKSREFSGLGSPSRGTPTPFLTTHFCAVAYLVLGFTEICGGKCVGALHDGPLRPPNNFSVSDRH